MWVSEDKPELLLRCELDDKPPDELLDSRPLLLELHSDELEPEPLLTEPLLEPVWDDDEYGPLVDSDDERDDDSDEDSWELKLDELVPLGPELSELLLL